MERLSLGKSAYVKIETLKRSLKAYLFVKVINGCKFVIQILITMVVIECWQYSLWLYTHLVGMNRRSFSMLRGLPLKHNGEIRKLGSEIYWVLREPLSWLEALVMSLL